MVIVFVIALVVVVAGLAAALFLGRIGGRLEPPTHTSAFEPLPEHDLIGADIDALRFDQTLRGYRMGQVDQVLDRLKHEIEERDRVIADFEAARHEQAYEQLKP